MSYQWIAEDPIHVVIRNEEPALYDTQGRLVKPAQRRVWAKFRRGTAPKWANEVAKDHFDFRKMPERGVSAEQWLAYYDVKEDALEQGWTEEEQEAIVQRLGVVAHAAVPVEAPRMVAPWPAYDKLVAKGARTEEKVAEKVAEKIMEDGYDARAVLAYEQENLNRPLVVAAVEALLVPVEEPAETVVSA